ncbi:OmcA/MtrC family decaheme c-type cytochrome [Halorhodospira halochloris]|uniref:OmcA/MtrC family decaheme c-type cytochrome n=1 Tax=Halorhodospira halochloris TaxID=1052 RepID=UPI001EE9521E|nr:OmcA/MtrC family decaheme c-type cytochrome [Halorhodospira halochloris]MCG5529271.1 OmcA/MtrC family decaheme c-type cytochrome [Halorhodospira halochloris]
MVNKHHHRVERWRRLLGYVLLSSCIAVVVAGCDVEDGDAGPRGDRGEEGDPGQDGIDGSPGALGELRPQVSINEVRFEDNDNDGINPVIEFEVKSETQLGLVEGFWDPEDVRFLLARQVDTDNGYRTWQSYIAQAAETHLPFRGEHANLQSDYESADEGELEEDNGVYTYRMDLDVTETPDAYTEDVDPVSEDHWVEYSDDDTHRLVVLLTPGDNWGGAYDHKDFVPNGGNPDAKRSVATESCNTCHDEVSQHGGSYVGVETCSTCHNQYHYHSETEDPSLYKDSRDLVYIGHEIHSMGYEGGSIKGETHHLLDGYADAFPGRIIDCANCHEGEDAGVDDRWKEAPSPQACLSCHDDFEEWYSAASWAHDEDIDDPTGATEDCVGCHEPGAGHPVVVDAHTDEAYEASLKTAYRIEDLEFNGDELTVTWGIEHDGEYVGEDWLENETAEVDIIVGWAEDHDYIHSEDDDRPGDPFVKEDVDYSGGDVETTDIDLSNNEFDAPDSGFGVVALENSVDSSDHEDLVVRNAVEYFPIGDPNDDERREVVAMDNCYSCHAEQDGAFDRHGGSSRNQVELCVVCHNPNSTDIDRRSGYENGDDNPDDLAEQPTNFMYLMHSLHGSHKREENIQRPGFTGFDEGVIDYPTTSANCTQCHVDETYYGAMETEGLRGTTFRTDDYDREAIENHKKVAATIAACTSCHDDKTAAAHIEQNDSWLSKDDNSNGLFFWDDWWTQDDLDMQYQTCANCHGPGRTADIEKVHNLP